MDANPGTPRRRRGILQRPCPQCGQVSLRRVGGSRRGEGLPASGNPYSRHTHMHCVAEGCGFDGWVPRRLRRRHAANWARRRLRRWAGRLQPWLRALGGLALLGLVAGVGATAGSVWQQAQTPTLAEQRLALPPGEYHDGDPLPAAHPLVQPAALAAAPLDYRGACIWGRPGRSPYQGSVAEAVRAAQLPAAIQEQFVAKAAARQRDGRLTIANDAIRETTGPRVFAPLGFAMTYGRTICLETRVNFPAGHTEPADLYEARDAAGRVYWMMVPDVCGNVSFIGAGRRAAGKDLRSEIDSGIPAQLKLATQVGGQDDDPVRTVPEPGTLACLMAALFAWVAVAMRRRSLQARQLPQQDSGREPPAQRLR